MDLKTSRNILKKLPFRKSSGLFKEPLINKLYLLLGIFIFTIASILIIGNYFDKTYTLHYQNTIRNQEQKQRIESLLKENLLNINLNFRSYSSITHPQQVNNLQNEIRQRINRSLKILEKLDKGGSVTVVKAVNMEDADRITEVIEYQPDEFTGTISEIRDIPSMLYELQSLSAKITGSLKGQMANTVTIPAAPESLESINFYKKQAESIFARIYEIENQISFKISKTISGLNDRSLFVFERYSRLKYLSLIVFSLLVATLTFILINQIRVVIIHRRKAEETTTKLLKAVEQSPVSIMITNTNGIIEYVNKSFEQRNGLTKKEIEGSSLHMLQSDKDDE
ncbi:PAS domain-containing protein, partial [Marinilabilia sp.]|uniref:PAS domain-containing protein n=1 Tax=Marinilabilia sp. TaxID=2021252 RepID=UPI0025BD410A